MTSGAVKRVNVPSRDAHVDGDPTANAGFTGLMTGHGQLGVFLGRASMCESDKRFGKKDAVPSLDWILNNG